jgi:hypothetical protein
MVTVISPTNSKEVGLWFDEKKLKQVLAFWW